MLAVMDVDNTLLEMDPKLRSDQWFEWQKIERRLSSKWRLFWPRKVLHEQSHQSFHSDACDA